MRLKHVLRYPFDIRSAERHLTENRESTFASEGTSIGLDLYTDQMLFDCGRHLACIAAHAKAIGSRLTLRCSRVMLAAIGHKTHGEEFLSMPNVNWIRPSQPFPIDSLVFLDVDGAGTDRILTDQRTVSMLVGRDVVERTLVMPYPMLPSQISSLSNSKLDSLRSKSKAGVFFAGNQSRRYGRESMQDDFGVLSRLEIVTTLRHAFPGRIDTRESGGHQDRIVLRNSATDPVKTSDWMSVMSDHKYFLCCPGSSQPMCHNVIEAMSIGMIPIIEYSDRFHPALADGVNAIVFRGRKGLVNAIERLDSMPEQKQDRISQNVCEYYDQNLCGTAFLRRLRDELNTDFVDQVSMPFHNDNFFSLESPPSGRIPAIRSRAA